MKLRRSNRPEVRGFLDDGTEIMGDLHFSDVLHFHGKLTGRVISDGELVVGEKGFIDGDVEVGTLTLSGTVQGNIFAQHRVHIQSTGRVQGDVCTPILKVDEGANWEGRIKTNREMSGGNDRLLIEHESPLARGAGIGG